MLAALPERMAEVGLEPALLARIVGVGFGVPEVTIAVLGALAFTQEVHYGTITSRFLVEPR